MHEGTVTTDELMIVNAARNLGVLAADGHPVCFVRIGLPSKVVNLARLRYLPAPVLVYESGCIGTKALDRSSCHSGVQWHRARCLQLAIPSSGFK